MALEPSGKFHEWKGRKQAETTGYPFGNGPPFLDATGPVFPSGVDASITLAAGVPSDRVVGFTASGGKAPYTFDFRDGSAPVSDPDGGLSHTFLAAGTFAVRAVDSLGRKGTVSVTVV